jgi:hypothetical protein
MTDTSENIEKAQRVADEIYANSAAIKADYGLPFITVKGENIQDIKKHSFVIDLCLKPRDAEAVFSEVVHIYDDLRDMINLYEFVIVKERDNKDATNFIKAISKKKAHIKSCITKLGKQVEDAQKLDADYLDIYAYKKANEILNSNSSSL